MTPPDIWQQSDRSGKTSPLKQEGQATSAALASPYGEYDKAGVDLSRLRYLLQLTPLDHLRVTQGHAHDMLLLQAYGRRHREAEAPASHGALAPSQADEICGNQADKAGGGNARDSERPWTPPKPRATADPGLKGRNKPAQGNALGRHALPIPSPERATQRMAGRLKIWDAATGELLQTLGGHSNIACRLAYSPDGRQFASAGLDGAVRIWQTDTGQ